MIYIFTGICDKQEAKWLDIFELWQYEQVISDTI